LSNAAAPKGAPRRINLLCIFSRQKNPEKNRPIIFPENFPEFFSKKIPVPQNSWSQRKSPGQHPVTILPQLFQENLSKKNFASGKNIIGKKI